MVSILALIHQAAKINMSKSGKPEKSAPMFLQFKALRNNISGFHMVWDSLVPALATSSIVGDQVNS